MARRYASSARGRCPSGDPTHDEGPPRTGRAFTECGDRVVSAHLVSGASFGSLAYASAAFSLVTMTGGSR